MASIYQYPAARRPHALAAAAEGGQAKSLNWRLLLAIGFNVAVWHVVIKLIG